MFDYKNSGIHGYMTDEDLDWLHQAVTALPDKAVIVELGSFQGRSAVAMGAACLGTKKHIYCVDKWEGTFPGASGEPVDSAAAFRSFKNNIQCFGLDEIVTPLQGNTAEVGQSFSIEIDMLFIDASHFYQDVLNDIRAWEPKVKLNGIISGHDWDRGHCQVNDAVVEVFGPTMLEKQKQKRFAHHIWDLIKDQEYVQRKSNT